jgi:hypothetical protein
MDADVKLDPDFLLALRYQIAKGDKSEDDNFDLFSCLIKLDPSTSKKLKGHISVQTVNSRLLSMSKTAKPRLFGAMLGIRADLFGGVRFDEDIKKFAEDVFFVQDAVAKGMKFKMLRTPKYVFSFRRWEDEALLRTFFKTVKLELHMIMGDRYGEVDYEMDGGTKYKPTDD